jgi:pilus assembly protein CpaF
MSSKQVSSETILRSLEPVRQYLEDPSVSVVMINGPNQVYIERHGKLEKTGVRFSGKLAVLSAMRTVAQYCGKQIDEYSPILEAHLPDGSRVQGVLNPIATTGPYLSIRRFLQSKLTLPYLVENGSLSAEAGASLAAMVKGKLNILVAGGTGTGKTSLLNLLGSFVPDGERVCVLEDSKEVHVQREHVVQLEARSADEASGYPAVSIHDLFRAALRMRPDRIIVGEIRGGEALDIVQAMVSGHGGFMGTVHGTSPEDALMRLETMATMSNVRLPHRALRMQVASGINLIVQVVRQGDGRRLVSHITEVRGFDEKQDSYRLSHLFERRYTESGPHSTLVRRPGPSGFTERLRAHGINIDGPENLRAAAAHHAVPSAL